VAGVGWMMGDGEGEGNKGEGGETHFGSCGGGLLGLAWVGDDLVSCGRTCRCNIYVSRGRRRSKWGTGRSRLDVIHYDPAVRTAAYVPASFPRRADH